MAWLQRFQQQFQEFSVPRRVPYGQRLTGLALAIAAIAAAPVAQAQSILEESGSLSPMEERYTFTGEAGQAVTIRLRSEEFDPVLVLLDPSGAELATNDDAERTLNSRIVHTLPRSGTYTILARSFGSNGGSFTVSVNPATALDVTLSEAEALLFEGNTEGAITQLDRAIAENPDSGLLHWYRADAYLYSNSGDMTDKDYRRVQEMALADYRRAQTLFEEAGDSANASIMADMINSLNQAENPAENPDMAP
ncbi:MAG: PPC domain-containing protein [Cyanobacteria bacterium]|nr:PPC domain-containing protein [Cyanobacteriota bacterium]